MKTFLNTAQHVYLLPGVVAADNLAEWFWDEVYNNGTNVDEWRWCKDFAIENDRYPEPEEWAVFDEPTWLVGDWELTSDEQWEPANGGNGFSAILQWLGGAAIVTVVASVCHTHVRSMCSPCCPGQANLDSGYSENGYICYSLPENWYRQEGE